MKLWRLLGGGRDILPHTASLPWKPSVVGLKQRSLPLAYLLARDFHSSIPSYAFRPVAFYTIAPIEKETIRSLRDTIENRLKTLGIVGRIYLAPKDGIGGINCQMAVPVDQLEAVKSFFSSLEVFQQKDKSIQYTEGLQDTETASFRNLRVVIKRNLVATQKAIQTEDLKLQPEYLDPATWHKELTEKGSNAFLLDMRNHYEYDIGHFEHAKKMDVDTFREGMDVMEDLIGSRSKEQDIYMYCTGGIRCSVAGSYLRNKGYQRVKMLKGGVTAYGHYVQLQNKPSLFRGKNFTFDGRRGERVTDDVLSFCHQCGAPCDSMTNCINTRCHLLFILCEQCRAKTRTCSQMCQDTVDGKVQWTAEYDYHRQIRPPPLKQAV